MASPPTTTPRRPPDSTNGPTSRPRPRAPRGLPALVRVLSVPITAAILLAGGWVTGGLITNDFTLSMVLTTAWVGFVGLVCIGLVLRRREMWPALAAFVVTVTVAGAYLGVETLIDDRVDEDVVTAGAPATGSERANPDGPPPNVLLASGRFESLEHETSGIAQVIQVPDGRRFLTLTRFETDNGPDLRVYLSTPDVSENSSGDDFEDLGGLKGNVGDQQYEIPPEVSLDRLTNALIWCRAFSVGFGAAALQAR
jgi:hypothetical protein